MATTSNSYTGNNSTVDFAFTFPYLKTTDIKVSVDEVVKTLTTHYTLHNATTIRFNTAPANNAKVKIYRDTASDSLAATFYPGSAIRSSDLNDNYNQNLYVTQEAENDASTALDNSRVLESGAYVSAITKAASAQATANSAVTTATSANTTANNATTTANNATTTANNAVTTANAASASVASAAIYTQYANFAALPAISSSTDGDFLQVNDSTAISRTSGTFSPSSIADPNGVCPNDFQGDDELTVKLKINNSSSKYDWIEYYSNDPESRYRKKLIVENKQTISENYTIGTSNNGYSVGPVTIASGYTVTIPANAVLFIN